MASFPARRCRCHGYRAGKGRGREEAPALLECRPSAAGLRHVARRAGRPSSERLLLAVNCSASWIRAGALLPSSTRRRYIAFVRCWLPSSSPFSFELVVMHPALYDTDRWLPFVRPSVSDRIHASHPWVDNDKAQKLRCFDLLCIHCTTTKPQQVEVMEFEQNTCAECWLCHARVTRGLVLWSEFFSTNYESLAR